MLVTTNAHVADCGFVPDVLFERLELHLFRAPPRNGAGQVMPVRSQEVIKGVVDGRFPLLEA